MMFSDLESYLFPDNVCVIPFMGGIGYSSNDDDEKASDSDETVGSHELLESHEPFVTSLSLGEPRERAPSETRSVMTEPKRVRFAMDDETSIRKRRTRNLKKVILQKSAEERRNNDEIPGNSGDQTAPLSPIASNRRTPKARIRRHRYKKINMASLVEPV
jgi:hypothetical protein